MSMHARIQHIVWDWNGTLFDDTRVSYEASAEVFAARGLRPVTFDEYRTAFTRPIAVFYEALFGWRPDPDTFAGIDEQFHDAYRRRLESCQLATDATEALVRWTGTDRSQSLLSMWRHTELEAAVHAHRIADRFSRVDGLTGPGGGRKAAHLARHLARLGLDGSDVVLVGDSVDDADAAHAAGARCVLYSGGCQTRARLETVGVPVADSLVGALDHVREMT